ncbi:hypothetical protein PsorP6_001326 [Peronosclerospora sorghi]|uniref:Uncharacterized protein n=1 Tax=Peronosclerospora sorghi TaxID=230839 RepID=A0ACC0WZ48_9STRA|nr:hypothetical protein PsorP6_001326 [Peronosclerospora sorghi]
MWIKKIEKNMFNLDSDDMILFHHVYVDILSHVTEIEFGNSSKPLRHFACILHITLLNAFKSVIAFNIVLRTYKL